MLLLTSTDWSISLYAPTRCKDSIAVRKMRKKKTRQASDEFFQTPELPTHIFRAGDVGRILGIEKWRLEKFLTGKQFRLSASGQLGKGQGSWRLFSHQDIYRLGIANRMVNDGFTAKFVSVVLQEVEDSELLDFDEHGRSTAPNLGLFRSNKGPYVAFVSAEKSEPYYVLKLWELIRDIDKRIHAERTGK